MILTNSLISSVTLSASSNVFYIPEVVFLVVAGGGGGGASAETYYAGGGGGAGGVTSGYFNVPASSTTATITVGQGGIKGVLGVTTATAGSSSSLTYNLTTYLSTGGGAGAVGKQASGGGVGGTSGNGFAPGAQTYNNAYGGPGGGASTNGYSNPGGSPNGNGGLGIYYPRFTLWGTDSTNSIIPSVGKGYFGGGGGASGWSAFGVIGPGGVGGGGTGTYVAPGATDGLANTGGGGGGGGAPYGTLPGGNGAAGIVIVTYPDSYPAAASTTGSPTITVTNGFRYYAFTSSGSITF